MKSSPSVIHAKDAQASALQWNPIDFGDQKLAKASPVTHSSGHENGQAGENLFVFPNFGPGADAGASSNGNGKKAQVSPQAGNGAKGASPQLNSRNGAAEMRVAQANSAPGQVESQPFFLTPAAQPSRMRFIKGNEPEAQNAFSGWLAEEFNSKPSAEVMEAPDFNELRQQIITETLALAKIQAQEQTERILRVARSQADEICQKAHAEASEVTRQAYREGIASAQAEATEMLTLARMVVDEVRNWREDMLVQSEPVVLGLVQEIASKVFGNGLVLEAEVLKTTFENALAEARSLGDLRIRAHPEDVSTLGALWPAQMTALTGQKIDLVPNQDLERGSCYIEGQFGSVDARVKTQMRMVNETFGRVLAEEVQPTNPFTTDVEADLKGQ